MRDGRQMRFGGTGGEGREPVSLGTGTGSSLSIGASMPPRLNESEMRKLAIYVFFKECEKQRPDLDGWQPVDLRDRLDGRLKELGVPIPPPVFGSRSISVLSSLDEIGSKIVFADAAWDEEDTGYADVKEEAKKFHTWEEGLSDGQKAALRAAVEELHKARKEFRTSHKGYGTGTSVHKYAMITFKRIMAGQEPMPDPEDMHKTLDKEHVDERIPAGARENALNVKQNFLNYGEGFARTAIDSLRQEQMVKA
jgi:hypothetical protein